MHHAKTLYEKGLVKRYNMITQSQFSQLQFRAKLDNIKTFYNALKAINFDEDATLIINENGLKAIVEKSKYVQASLYVTRACFSEFMLRDDEEITIRLNLTIITDCLSVFANPECSVKMIYKGRGSPFVLVLEQHDEDDLITEVSVKTKNGDEPIEFTLDEDSEQYNSIIVRGQDFFDLLSDIHKSVEILEIFLSPNSPYFRLTSLGIMQTESNVEIARTSDMFVTFLCRTESNTQYKMSHIRLANKALSLASKVALRNDQSGLLGLQIMVLSDGDSQIYIEFFIIPLIDTFGF